MQFHTFMNKVKGMESNWAFVTSVRYYYLHLRCIFYIFIYTLAYYILFVY